jgi:hypothetical protein
MARKKGASISVDINPEPIPLYEPPAYLIALGRFITRFSMVEGELNKLVWQFAKLDKEPQVARAVFHSLRIDRASEILRRLTRSRHLRSDKVKELESILQQLALIATARNDIVHLGPQKIAKNGFVVDNAKFAISKNRIKRFVVSVPMLDAMSIDLVFIFLRIFMMTHATKTLNAKFSRLFGGGPEWVDDPSWRYIPRQQRHDRR